MAAAELPNWVWDLLIVLRRHEDEHSSESGCLQPALDLVPIEIRDQAAAVEAYMLGAVNDQVARQVEKNWDAMMDALIGATGREHPS
ncbi:hypothetical protein OG897_13595 [Streptomyces sp. NBC_00237]|uniref:hypothetical protein n=1 Tax=Streptomyces sp. NBC_00237 TaxID=2975687 RepID=UPI00225425B5|nr:hypothetical protein [Streptomyces sp. NBC_00237]MCX5202477.1 hypothetical protein [Streptomyces sp. NBC_00237]